MQVQVIFILKNNRQAWQNWYIQVGQSPEFVKMFRVSGVVVWLSGVCETFG